MDGPAAAPLLRGAVDVVPSEADAKVCGVNGVAEAVGCSNTQLGAKTGPPIATEAGVDTWKLVRYLDDDRDLERALSLCQDTGRGLALSDLRPSDHVVGVQPGYRMLFAEGHPAVEALAHPSTLPEASERVLRSLEAVGFPLGRDAGLGRVDGTVTLSFETPNHGLAVLQGVAALDFPRSMPVVYGKPPQTVYIAGERTGSRKARIYDKARESLLGPPGSLVRFENQVRYAKDTRRAVEEVDLNHVRRRFEMRFGPMARSASGLTVASLPVIASTVAERVRSGDMTTRQAERLVGFMALHQAGHRTYPGRTMKRRRAELRAAGLVLADDFFEPVSVNLGDTIEAALAAWSDG